MRTAPVFLVAFPLALPLALLAATSLNACEAETEVTRAQILLTLPGDPGCQPPPGPGRVVIVAAGDFPASEETVEVLVPDSLELVTISKFPFGTESLSFELRSDGSSDFLAGAQHRRAQADSEDILLLLPLGASCGTPDPDVRAPDLSALAPLPGGGYLVAGGLRDDGIEARSQLLLVPKDEATLAETLSLATRRVGAVATRAGDRILISGGSERDDLPAEESFEVFDDTAGALDLDAAGRMCAGADVCRRRDHGATALEDGRVLLAGGVIETGEEELASAVLIDPRTGAVTEAGDLGMPRRKAAVLTLSGGGVVVLGGMAGTAFVLPVEAFDSASLSFGEVDNASSPGAPLLPDRGGAAFVALPGGRVVAVGGLGDLEGAATVLVFDGPRRAARIDVTLRGFVALDDAHAVALDDERILVVGRDGAGARRAFRVDVGRGTAEELDPPTHVTTELVPCDDGAVAEVSPSGGAYRRLLVRSPFDTPPAALLPSDASWLALAAAPLYAAGPGGLEALEAGAPVSVASLRFVDVMVRPTVTGGYDVVLTDEAGTAFRVVVDGGSVSLGECRAPRAEDELVTITIRGATATLEAGAAPVECALPASRGSLAVVLELDAGSSLRALELARL